MAPISITAGEIRSQPAGGAQQPFAGARWRALIIDGATVFWPQTDGTSSLVLRYAFATSTIHNDSAINCRIVQPLDAISSQNGIGHSNLRAAAGAAFRRWEQAAALNFIEVDDASQADIVIGAQGDPHGFAFTNVDLGASLGEGRRAIAHASICLNPERHWKIGFDGNLSSYDLVHTLTHEIGHAIGLDHPGARGSVMAFRYDELHSGLSAGDIVGVTAIYGAR